MATLINNAGVQHYANKMVLAENRKVGSKSLPTALADIDNLIDEMKTHFDAEYGSALDMKLENNENVFSVGTGTNIDKRSEVENSFTDVELSGNSLVNLVSTKGSNLFGTSGSGAVFNTTFNTDSTRCLYTTKEETDRYITIRTGSKERIKSNTTYTLIFNILKNNISELQRGISIRGSSDPYYTQMVSAPYFNIYTDSNFNITSGIKVISFTTGNNANEYTGFGFGFPSVKTNVAGQQFEIGDVVLLEGDWTNKPIPQYFEGMKSVGQDDVNGHKIEILSNNGNLWNGEFEIGSLDVGNGTENDNGTNRKRTSYIEIMPNKQCSFKINDFVQVSGTDNYNVNIHFYDSNKQAILNSQGKANYYYISNGNIFTFTTPTNAKYVRMRTEDNRTLTPLSLTLTYGTTVIATQGKSNKKEISLNEPLRGLPNGIRDTIEKINGEWKIVRRCGEVILDNSLTYNNHRNDDENFDEYKISNFPINTIRQSTSISDKFPQTTYDRAVCTSGVVYIRFSKAREINTLEKCQQWFANNPTKIVYALETPIIEDVSPVTLQCWKNGTISIDEILPVESTHTVALNKPAQIKKNIEELTVLRKRVQALEDFYDQIALEQAHQLSLINHSIELDYDI